MQKNNWNWFLIALGTLIILIAPTTNALFPQIISGIFLIAIGLYLNRKNR